MSDLKEQLRQILAKEASAADSSLLDSAEQTPAPVASSVNPANMQTGESSDLTTDAVGADGRVQPGTSSEITNVSADSAGPGGVDVTVIEGNQEGEAAKVLGIKEGEITKEESIDVINKAANAIKAIGSRLMNISDEDLAGSFRKQASAPMSAQEMLIKAASEGDTTAQYMVDFLASYELGLAKKANDLKKIAEAGATPEQVAEAEDALNEQAIEDPGILMDEEEMAADIDPALAEVGAEIEAAAQEATMEVAEAILAEDPSISEDEALEAAQEAVVDAIMTIDAQQAMGATDENGNYMVDDEAAAGAVDELAKTASAHPMRDAIVGQLNQRFGLSPEAFAKRLGFR